MTDEMVSGRQGVLDGLAIYARLRGTERVEAMRRTVDSGVVGSTMTAMSMEFVFGQVWSRDVLDAKQRSLVTIGILIALRQSEELKNHIRIGLTNGLTVRQIEEATIQAAAYAGFPAAQTASNVILEVLQDPSVAAPSRTGGHSQYNTLLAAQPRSNSETFDPLDRWIAEHLKEDLRVDALAERVHMSPRNFARAYAEKRGCTPAKAVEAIRVEAARRRLEETEDRIESVAEDSGFSSEEQMRCAFIRILGIPPRKYRKRFATTV
jgi:alkylhydroperoxidase/carboxymuconolactone decarboxylase family protein YurZ/AraC-like DNA-binding protein